MKTIYDNFLNKNIEVFEPIDCYFGIQFIEEFMCDDESHSVVVGFASKKCWNENHYQDDSLYFENNLLPDSLSESMESIYESSLSLEKTKELLNNLGFTYNQGISDLLLEEF